MPDSPAWEELRGFERDLLVELADVDEAMTTTEVSDAIRARLDEQFTKSTVYNNLESLVDADLVEKQIVDGRTNSYSLTELGRERVELRYDRFVDVLGIPAGADQEAVADGGVEAVSPEPDKPGPLELESHLSLAEVVAAVDKPGTPTIGAIADDLDVDSQRARVIVYKLGRYGDVSDVTGSRRARR